MDDTRLKKIGADLKKARARASEWEAKVRELERRYKEAENTCIHDMVHAANLTPEQLAVIIRKAHAGDFGAIPEITGKTAADAAAQKEKQGDREGPENE